jgi:two-component system, chemotaxis family, CheB/CheR fusion protein
MSEPDRNFEQLLEFVRDERGFDYTGYRRPTLMRRFQKRMLDVGADDWAAYRAYLTEHPVEFVELFNTILINVTGFFRDRETWDVVAGEVIPRMLEERPSDAPLRIWSAGCASGEEPYTIAMLLVEALGEESFKRRVKIYATDVDDDALSRARDAVYTLKQLESVPPDLRERYFQQSNHAFSFRTDLRRTVIFGRNDLHRDPPISRVDLLVSRNTLMYFGPDVQPRILANFYFALNRGGFLVVGKAEALQSGRNFFAPYNLKRRIFMKDGSADSNFRLPRIPALEAGEHDGPPFAGVIVSYVDATEHRTLEADLERAKRELETAYEELQSTVEELETTNEELQSTNEELETTNEELQSTNEELETMNEELQSTNEELETMNDELRERTDETLQANSFLGSVLSGIEQGVVVVDRTLRIVAWSRRATDLWGLRDDEVEGEHLLNLDIGIPVPRLRDPIRRVLSGTAVDDLELDGHDRRGKPVHVQIAFAPLQSRPEAEEPDGAILLVSAVRS